MATRRPQDFQFLVTAEGWLIPVGCTFSIEPTERRSAAAFSELLNNRNVSSKYGDSLGEMIFLAH